MNKAQQATLMELEFSDIAPYRDKDVPAAIQALLEEHSFLKVLRFVYPDKDEKAIRSLCAGIKTVKQFQTEVAYPAMKLMNERTITELSSTGFDGLTDDKSSLFISNHRDIILDSALLNMLMHEHGLETTETAIGSNLLKNPTVRHLTKLNKNFTVHRDVNRKELYQKSMQLSSYIRRAIKERNVSIWISQQEGRAKDGNDRTQQGLLKMLYMSAGQNVAQAFKELRIRPLALSYEYDPCDAFKLNELVKAESGVKHEKETDEDLMNIVSGISQSKGRVHLAVGPMIDQELENLDESLAVNDQVKQLTEIIDQHIHSLAYLWPNNYIAADKLSGRMAHSDQYSDEDVKIFEQYIDSVIDSCSEDIREAGRKILIKKYAYPLLNKVSVPTHSE